jgi:hypothetical protein
LAIVILLVPLFFTSSSLQFYLETAASLSDFGENIRIDDTRTSMILQRWPSVSSFGNNVYSAWEDEREGEKKIYFARSTDEGLSFQQNIRVDDSPGGAVAIEPSIAVDSSGTVYVAWADDRDGSGPRIFVASSTTNGESFGGSSRVNASVGAYDFREPAVATSGGKVGIGWLDYDIPRYVYYAESVDGGTSFGPTMKASDDGCRSASYPDLVINETGTAFMVWESYATATWMICFSKLLNNGSSFSSNIWISDDPTTGGQRMPSIALTSNGTIVVVWRDYRYVGYEILLSMSYDAGGTFTTPVTVFNYSAPGFVIHPSISVSPTDNVFVAWMDRWGGSYDVYVTNSTIEGMSFGGRIKVNNGGGSSLVPTRTNDVHASDVGAFLVWQDERRGDWDIYFARSPPFQRPPLHPTSLRITVNNTLNVRLDWNASESPNVTHYQIYRSENQTDFDFSTPIYDTSFDLDPLRINWTDFGAASAVAPSEYYYIVQAVNEQGLRSITSNTAGKWTKQFKAGLNSFSLPLEPLEETNISWYADNIANATFVRWMNDSGRWVTYYRGMGDSTKDTIAKMGHAYEIYLENASFFTFCGYPGSMIRFAEGGVGDPVAFRTSLNATVQNEDVVLDWLGIGNISGYNILRSDRRNGLHNLSLQPVAWVNSSVTSWRDVNILGKGGEYYYMVIPFDTSGGLGSSTYSVGVYTFDYQSGSDTFALPLKLEDVHSLDWYCDEIPDVVGMAYLSMGRWTFHAKDMPEGVFDRDVLESEGYQISFNGFSTKLTFVGD